MIDSKEISHLGFKRKYITDLWDHKQYDIVYNNRAIILFNTNHVFNGRIDYADGLEHPPGTEFIIKNIYLDFDASRSRIDIECKGTDCTGTYLTQDHVKNTYALYCLVPDPNFEKINVIDL